MLAAFETAALDPSRFQTFLFMTANVLLQEMGHVFVTYLSRGQPEEPRKRIKGLRGPFATEFDEADRALEDKLFNGRIHYFRDPISGTPDDQVCSKGLPCSMASNVAITLMCNSSAARLTWKPFSWDSLAPAPIIASCGNQSRISPASVSSLPFPNDFCLPFPVRPITILH